MLSPTMRKSCKVVLKVRIFSFKSKAWNDKVDAHHAIIPTPKKSSVEWLFR
ncbi:hypothetical protein O9993_13780 [Vibrio lentus]|nr:hypothetical protein [Vibrio lentus]